MKLGYTHGSKTQNGIGAGFFFNNFNIKISITLDKTQTIFQANKITLQWPNGHSIAMGNNNADKLTKMGSEITVCTVQLLSLS